MQSLFFKNIKM